MHIWPAIAGLFMLYLRYLAQLLRFLQIKDVFCITRKHDLSNWLLVHVGWAVICAANKFLDISNSEKCSTKHTLVYPTGAKSFIDDPTVNSCCTNSVKTNSCLKQNDTRMFVWSPIDSMQKISG
uniref:Putative secreted protein n=1 Tax=Rhipicephalus microplus TaxID=6941 RepID=A0A6G5A4I6_RHIMP